MLPLYPDKDDDGNKYDTNYSTHIWRLFNTEYPPPHITHYKFNTNSLCLFDIYPLQNLP